MIGRRVLSALCALSGVGGLALLLDGCGQQSVTATLRSLQASSDVTFVCRAIGSDGHLDQGAPLEECPDPSADPTRRMLAVVTQTTTNELAVVDVQAPKVVDVNPSVPGYSFLHLPSRPGAITTTPGGDASFVGLTSPGKTGISAIPTTCLGAPLPGQRERDVTSFAACSLPSAPGDMVVLVEPPDADGNIAASCDEPCASPGDPGCETQTPPGAAEDRDCPANLTAEKGPRGRRKLVVSLPDEGALAIIDAQSLLDRAPGSFEPCDYQKVDLDAQPDLSGQHEVLPDDLESVADGMCSIPEPTPPPVPPAALSRPSGLAATDGRLYAGDAGVPAVHVLDTRSVCAMRELPPLLPMSFDRPSRVVTTSRVAVSPVTPEGKQFVYAIDPDDKPASSIMAFDVSPGVTNRTPIVRSGSARHPSEVPDRLSFWAPVQDVDFAFRDLPREDPTTGVAEIGVSCDPDPAASIDPPTPGVQYRTTADFTQGARPRLLRGLFGLALLTSGQVAVVDIDDFDAPCRRPVTTNVGAEEPDFRGCLDDAPRQADYPPYLTTTGDADGSRTVSGEVSCNMVEPHRPRAASFGISAPTLGIGAPSLRGAPLYSPPDTVATDVATARPQLLAVPFESDGGSAPPVVYIGTTLYSPSTSGAFLRVDPNDGLDANSLVLPLVEPRSYVASDHNTLTFEGPVLPAPRPSGFIDDAASEVDDASAFFCNSGVYDPAAMADYARSEWHLSTKEAEAFGAAHADYVQVTGDFPSVIDPYWQSAPLSRATCLAKFGDPARPGATDLVRSRDLDILEAYQDHLLVAPAPLEDWVAPAGCSAEGRAGDPACHPPTLSDFEACFPGGLTYTVRGRNQWVLSTSRPGVQSDIVADPSNGYRCVRDCDPRKAYFRSRAFEIGRTADACTPDPADAAAAAAIPDRCSLVHVGLATGADGPCAYDPISDAGATRGVDLTDRAAACIFENLTSRFAVYRGLQPSVRGMHFSWDTTGGFTPLVASLTSLSNNVLPQRLKYLDEYQGMAIVDAASLGLSLISLDTLAVEPPWPVY